MSSRSKSVTLYNVIFPSYIFFLTPFFGSELLPLLPVFLGILVLNFIIDGIVIFTALSFCKEIKNVSNFLGLWIRVWLWGFVADIIGAASLALLERNGLYSSYGDARAGGIVGSLGAVYVFLAITLAGLLIGIGNYYFLKKYGVTQRAALYTAIIMGVLTAPWLFLTQPQ